MHKEILSEKQLALLPVIKKFSNNFVLVGGTAIALHLEHRKSIDYDLFTFEEFNNIGLRKILKKIVTIEKTLVDGADELTVIVNGVQLTFYTYPYKFESKSTLDDIIKVPDLLTLASLKAFALGQRNKWKDYVDLYFILREHFTIQDISQKGREVFKEEFNEKLFRTQLSYFEDINYSEKVDFLPGFEVKENEIKRELKEFSLS